MPEHTMKTARILIVDDQEGNLRLLERVLTSAGYTHLKTLTDSRSSISQVSNLQQARLSISLALFRLWIPQATVSSIMPPRDENEPVLGAGYK